MQPNVSNADDLRLRYRRPTPVVRRPVRSDVSQRRPVTALQPAQPSPAINRPPVQPAPVDWTVQEIFQLNLSDVAAAPARRYRYLVKPRHGLHYGMMALILLMLSIGGYVSWQGYQSNHALTKTLNHIQNTAHKTTVQDSSVPPSTNKTAASSLASYKVAADMPRYIRIGSLGVTARVRSLGVTKDGAVATPANVYDSGWYNGSAKPGTAGAALIVGHVSSWTTHGVFYDLKKLKPGAVVEIERGDGSKLQYKVVKTEVYDADDVNMNSVLQPATNGKAGLNLMTCTGQVKKGTSEFNQRLVVFTDQV